MIQRAAARFARPLRGRAPPLTARSLCKREMSFASDISDDDYEALTMPRLTKIVATIGPASEEKEPLEQCVAAGMNVMRVNFSHATKDEFHLRRNNLRNNPAGECVAIMLDTKGPEIRMGGLRVCKESGDRKAKVSLVAGETLTLTTDQAYDGASDAQTLFIDYPRLGEVVSPDDRVLLDDGLISLRVVQVVRAGGEGSPALIETEVLNSSEIGERKGVNLPGVKTGLPAMSEKDKLDIKFGVEHDIDMVAASFVRSADGVKEIRDYLATCLRDCGDPSRADEPLPLIISKIESTEALEELEAIVAESDGIMVARGDLGVEVPIEHIATYQKDIVELCAAAGKPVIVATQMLESMQKNPRPTRAEVADVTNAVLEGADAVMLSGESANGQYPAESVAMQAAICKHTEGWAAERGHSPSTSGVPSPLDFAMEEEHCSALGSAACVLAQQADASAILVYDHVSTGTLARAVAHHKPGLPIVAVSDSLKVCRQLAISRGVTPVFVADVNDPETGIEEHAAWEAGWLCDVVTNRTELLDHHETVVCVVGNQVSLQTVALDVDEDDE